MRTAPLLIFGTLALLRWIVLPAKIADARRIGAKMPTLQTTIQERVETLEEWRSLCRFGMWIEIALACLITRREIPAEFCLFG